MSAQTGVAPASGPMSRRFVDRARYQVDRWKTQPNPIWIRELKQSARLARTPVILAAATILMTLLIASIGGIMAVTSAPDRTGIVLFQVFFSLAYFVVTWIGPAVAANSIASEREGRTYEAVVLTGMRPGEIARGKFAAAYTALGMYIVMLAPVGALPFLFGGVTATEVVVAFVFLFLIALLSVAFGLAISSKMASLRGAIVITLLLSFPLSLVTYLGLGLGLSYAAHAQWPGVSAGPPVWLPSAYARAPFDWAYVVFLFALPVAVVALPAWFLYEVTIANLTSVTDDRSTGLKRWFLVTIPVVTIAAGIPIAVVPPTNYEELYVVGACALVVVTSFCAFLFQGEPIGPSRRVRVHWDRARASRFLRYLGPSITKAATLQLALGLGAFAVLTAFALLLVRLSSHPSAKIQAVQIAAFGVYAAAFHVFVIGLGAWLRARSTTPLAARAIAFAALGAIAIGPWVVAAIGGFIAARGSGRFDDSAMFIASPSPFYAFYMLDAAAKGNDALLGFGVAAAALWALLGVLLLGLASARTRRIIRDHESLLADADRRLAEEDQAAAAASAGPAAPPPEAAAAPQPP